jgi:hypothetical protein
MFARFVPRLVEMGADDVTVAIRHEWFTASLKRKSTIQSPGGTSVTSLKGFPTSR